MPLTNMRYHSIKFWVKILHIGNEKYVRKVYNTLYQETLVYPKKKKKRKKNVVRAHLFFHNFHNGFSKQFVTVTFLLTIKQT